MISLLASVGEGNTAVRSTNSPPPPVRCTWAKTLQPEASIAWRRSFSAACAAKDATDSMIPSFVVTHSPNEREQVMLSGSAS